MTRAFAALLVALVLLTAGCGTTNPPPTGSPGSVGPEESLPTADETLPPPDESARPAEASAGPDQTAAGDQDLSGAWSAEPFELGDSQVAIISDACAAKARKDLGEDQANLPTTVVDARGQGLVTTILSDDANAIVCWARMGANGTATVAAVDGLATTSFDPQDGSGIGVTELVGMSDPPGERTIAFGRVGPDPAGVRLGLADQSSVTSAVANGWWLAWWPGSRAVSSITAVDANGGQLGSAPAPTGEVESRLGPASWWLDPTALAPNPDATTIPIKVLEQACASGDANGLDRLDAPDIALTDTSITVKLSIRRLPGAQDCQGNAPFSFNLDLPEPLGNRALLDGSSNPPRDATKPPAG